MLTVPSFCIIASALPKNVYQLQSLMDLLQDFMIIWFYLYIGLQFLCIALIAHNITLQKYPITYY